MQLDFDRPARPQNAERRRRAVEFRGKRLAGHLRCVFAVKLVMMSPARKPAACGARISSRHVADFVTTR